MLDNAPSPTCIYAYRPIEKERLEKKSGNKESELLVTDA